MGNVSEYLVLGRTHVNRLHSILRCNVYDLSTIKRPDIRTVRERGEMRKREQGVKRFRPVEVVGIE
jgi:hypothetical protein